MIGNSNIYNGFKSAGQNIAITWRGGGVSQGWQGRAQANPNTYNISFTNSNGYTVNLNGNSTGGSRSLGAVLQHKFRAAVAAVPTDCCKRQYDDNEHQSGCSYLGPTEVLALLRHGKRLKEPAW